MFCLIPAPKCLDTFGIIYAAALPCSILTYAKSYKVTNARDPIDYSSLQDFKRGQGGRE